MKKEKEQIVETDIAIRHYISEKQLKESGRYTVL